MDCPPKQYPCRHCAKTDKQFLSDADLSTFLRCPAFCGILQILAPFRALLVCSNFAFYLTGSWQVFHAGCGCQSGWREHVCRTKYQAYWWQHHGTCIYHKTVAQEGARREQNVQNHQLAMSAREGCQLWYRTRGCLWCERLRLWQDYLWICLQRLASNVLVIAID